MRTVQRILGRQILIAAKAFPAVVLTGPRRSGKTFLLKNLFPQSDYYLFEDPDVVSRFRADPQGFLDAVSTPVIFDEIQNVPEIFNFVRARIDRNPRRTGQWLLTGSQESALMGQVTESMAGRAAVLQLLPLSANETPKVDILRGGFPEVLARPRTAALWFSSYLQTYLERDVRSMTNVHDLILFRRFFALVASRHGQVINKSDLAAPLGITVPSVGRWLDILQATGQVIVVPPYFENLGKRLIKSPKVYIADSGLACHLLGIQSAAELERSPFLGSIFEGFIASEITKSQLNAGHRCALYHFRDQQGLEVDFIVPRKQGTLFVEAKATHSPVPKMAAPMHALASSWRAQGKPHGDNQNLDLVLVHRPSKSAVASTALSPGARAVAWPDFIRSL